MFSLFESLYISCSAQKNRPIKSNLVFDQITQAKSSILFKSRMFLSRNFENTCLHTIQNTFLHKGNKKTRKHIIHKFYYRHKSAGKFCIVSLSLCFYSDQLMHNPSKLDDRSQRLRRMFRVCGEMEIVKQRPSWRKRDVVNIEDCESGQQFQQI